MLKIEKKLLLWAEKHMFVLMALLAAAIAFYLKRLAVWWGSPDVAYYYDNHVNSIQSSFYYVLVKLTQYLPLLPLHSMKWLAGIADYGVAALCVLAVGGHKEPMKLKSTFYFTVCVLSPVVFLRGICWGQLDSAAFAFLLGAYLLWEREKKAAALVLALISAAIYPCFLLFALGYLLYRYKGIQGEIWIYVALLTVGCFLAQGFSGLLLGQSWGYSAMSTLRWLTYDLEGAVFGQPLAWVEQMVNLFGYGAAMISGIVAYRHKISYISALLIHLAVLLVYASAMFPIQ